MLKFTTLITILTLIIIYDLSLGEYNTQDCKQLGFVKTQLMCSSCNKLDDYGLETLKEHCKECCQRDDFTRTIKRYPKAILEICTCKFGAYPQIQAFIKSDRPAKFPNLQIRYVRGLDPTVKLLDKSGNVKETLSITKWNTDTVQEFFETVLEQSHVSDDDKNDVNEDDSFLRTNLV